MKRYSPEKELAISAWKKRMSIWSKENTKSLKDSEGSVVNYHWGYHAGMVSMAKEAQVAIELLEIERLEEENRQLRNAYKDLTGNSWEGT